jgi:hypothetical protein
MRELIAEEIMSVVGAGSAWCEMVSGRLECEGDYIEYDTRNDDMWVYGNDGTWFHVHEGQVVGQGGDLN